MLIEGEQDISIPTSLSFFNFSNVAETENETLTQAVLALVAHCFLTSNSEDPVNPYLMPTRLEKFIPWDSFRYLERRCMREKVQTQET